MRRITIPGACFPMEFAKNGTFEMDPNFCVLNKKKIKKLEKLIQLKEKGVL